MKELLFLLLGLTLASAAHAQTGRRVALGVGLGYHKYADGDFDHKNPSLSIVYRLSSKKAAPRDGWSLEPKVTVDWFKTDVSTDIAGVGTPIGELRSISVLVGAGPAYRHGRAKVGVGVVAGPSFNTFTEENGATPVAVKNSFAVRPESSFWYDVSSRLGLHAGVSYLYNRPTADPASGSTAGSGKWKTDRLNYSVGFAIGIL